MKPAVADEEILHFKVKFFTVPFVIMRFASKVKTVDDA